MSKTVKNLNKLYASAFEKMENMSKFLGKNCVDHALDFHYGHRIKIDGQFTNELYPIPLIRFKLNGIKTETFFDVYTNKNYIGYIKLYPNKKEILSLDLETFASLKYLIYGYHYQHELYNSEDLKQTKINIEKSKDNKFIIYADFENLEQVYGVVESFIVKPSQRFSMTNYKCDCGHYITIESYNGSCPVCGRDSLFKSKYKTKCPVCKAKCLKDQYGNGECQNCGWKFDKYANKMKNNVIYPNLISLNKAKKLYSESKPFEPDLNDFVDALYNYSEMQFKYNGVCYAVELVCENDDECDIELYNSKTSETFIFKTKEDFIQNAKIDNEYVRDIWDKVENPCYYESKVCL